MNNKYSISHEKAEELIEQLYDGASNELPGDDLDRLIIDRANKDLQQPTGGVSKLIGWQRYSSLAASLLVAVTIGMIYFDNQQLAQPESELMMKQEAISVDESYSDTTMGGGVSIAEDEQHIDSSASVDVERAVLSVVPETAEVGKLEARKESKSALKKTQPRSAVASEASALSAPMPVREQVKAKRKAVFVESNDIVSVEPSENEAKYEMLISDIRLAIKQNDSDTANTLYVTLKEKFPGRKVPEDISAFFGNDL